MKPKKYQLTISSDSLLALIEFHTYMTQHGSSEILVKDEFDLYRYLGIEYNIDDPTDLDLILKPEGNI